MGDAGGLQGMIKEVDEKIDDTLAKIKLVDEIARLIKSPSASQDKITSMTNKLNPFLTARDMDELKKEKDKLKKEKDELKKVKLLLLEKMPSNVADEELNLCPGVDQGTSGILYDKQANKILVDNGNSSIGLVEKIERNWSMREGIPMVSPTGLADALKWINNDHRVRLEDAGNGLKNLDQDLLHNALVSGNEHKFNGIAQCGEMAFQQIVYAPFAMVFMAAAKGLTSYYAADQDVHSSLFTKYKTKTSDGYQEGVISMLPDSAATLGEKRDAFGMMKIKSNKNWDADHRIDYDKCVLMTATTAKIVSQLCDESMIEKIELPFIIAQGSFCSLYVMKVDKKGNQSVSSVKLKESLNSVNMDCSTSPTWARSAMLVTLAVLLNNFRSIWTSGLEDQYRLNFKTPVTECSRRKRIFSKPLSQKKQKSTGDIPSMPSGTGNGGEASAMEAASCGGKFVALKYPFLREIRFTESDVNLTCQEKSPFYFVCHSYKSQTETLDIFLKVWHVCEVDMELAKKECALLRRAHEGGIPVAGLKNDELIKTHSEDGHEYVVMAMENLYGHSISSESELVEFSLSLIYSVSQLHSIGLLHCDLKPDNVVWDGKTVKLIDFGHAQEVSGARNIKGTVGFEAPEILRNEPNSVETDAFSVGRAILASIDDFQCDKPSRTLRELECVGEGLATESRETRWSLNRACQHLKDTALQVAGDQATVTPFEESRVFATRERLPERSPPDKVPRVTQDMGTSLSAVKS